MRCDDAQGVPATCGGVTGTSPDASRQGRRENGLHFTMQVLHTPAYATGLKNPVRTPIFLI
jgi:hypothetical protein